MDDIYNADIQKAPVYPVLFEIEQDKQTILTIDLSKEFIVKCAIYVPEEMNQVLQQSDYFVYATLFVNESPVTQKIATIRPNHNPKNRILQLAIDFNISDKINSNEINFQMAITHKHQGEMGIGESLISGRFINTYIPLENKNDKAR